MCKLCDIEHSTRWTCAQARANQEDWLKPKTFKEEVKEIKSLLKKEEVKKNA